MRGFKPARFGPHDFNKGRHWFYVNGGSVDVCDGTSIIRVPRKALAEMMAALPPLPQKRAATKGRDAKRAVATVGAKRKKAL